VFTKKRSGSGLNDPDFIINQVFRRKNLVIRLRYVSWRVDGRAGVNNFFCAQLLLHFSMDFDQTFTEALSSSALAHIVGVLRLDNI
jgi:hypothetical protein